MYLYDCSIYMLFQASNIEVYETFDSMNLKPDLLRGIFSFGYERPSAIQQRAIVPCCSGKFFNLSWQLKQILGKDVIAQAQSGTGKTATFSVSVLQSIDEKLPELQALIMAPTRELAQQVIFYYLLINFDTSP